MIIVNLRLFGIITLIILSFPIICIINIEVGWSQALLDWSQTTFAARPCNPAARPCILEDMLNAANQNCPRNQDFFMSVVSEKSQELGDILASL